MFFLWLLVFGKCNIADFCWHLLCLSILSSCNHSSGSLYVQWKGKRNLLKPGQKNCWNLGCGITPIEEIPIFLQPPRVIGQRKVVYFTSDGEGSWNKWILLKERRSHSNTDKRWKWNNFLSSGKHSNSWQNNSSWVDGEGLVLYSSKTQETVVPPACLIKREPTHSPKQMQDPVQMTYHQQDFYSKSIGA